MGTGFWINLKSGEETGIAFTTVATAVVSANDATALSSMDSSSIAWDSEVSSRYSEMTALASSLRSAASITDSATATATATVTAATAAAATATATATTTSTGAANALSAFGDAGMGASTGASTLAALLACVVYMAAAAFGPRL